MNAPDPRAIRDPSHRRRAGVGSVVFLTAGVLVGAMALFGSAPAPLRVLFAVGAVAGLFAGSAGLAGLYRSRTGGPAAVEGPSEGS